MESISRNERVDYLFNTDLKIIQSNDLFPFSLDSVLLARFVYVPIQHGRLVDLCSGNGVIPFLLSQRTKGDITGIDIQPEVCSLAERGAVINHLEKRVAFICGDAKALPEKTGCHCCDVVTCNPPYFNKEAARDLKLNRHLAIARHEILIKLTDVLETAGKLLRQGGKFAMVHRPERLVEILDGMHREGMEPKRLQFVHPKIGKPANMVLVEGTKGGRPGLAVLPPITVYGADGHYTEDVWLNQ
ncbi:tRNA1(Val) (adenine(37)-N6)-methyltransferase [Sporolactobacillus pectinivorans]|uniref:tRNA1(Val) (adenine(37)-N6)-methyltransferase n=1 Tax=Sporolactobacillus pectinivorans TaxID=1591408 RepID=UPI003B84929E